MLESDDQFCLKKNWDPISQFRDRVTQRIFLTNSKDHVDHTTSKEGREGRTKRATPAASERTFQDIALQALHADRPLRQISRLPLRSRRRGTAQERRCK